MIPALVVKRPDPTIQVPRNQCRQSSNCHCNVPQGCHRERSSYTGGEDGQHIQSCLGLLESLQRPAAAHALLRMLHERKKNYYVYYNKMETSVELRTRSSIQVGSLQTKDCSNCPYILMQKIDWMQLAGLRGHPWNLLTNINPNRDKIHVMIG